MDQDIEMALEKTGKVWRAMGFVARFVLFVLIAVVVGLFVFRVFFVTNTENTDFVYVYDRMHGGEIVEVNHQGYVVAPPFLKSVHVIDTRPVQVCISANKRVLNCKLVQFNPAGFRLFLQWHGRGNYNIMDEGTGSLKDILMSYAYDISGKEYPFLTVQGVTDIQKNTASAAVEAPTSAR